MSDIELKDVLDSPEVTPEGEDTPKEPSPEKTEEPEIKKEEVVEKPPVPYDRFKEVNDELKTVRSEIQELKSKKEEEGLSEDEKKELVAKEFIMKAADEAYERRVVKEQAATAERENGIKEEIKFYNSIDKDFTEKIAEEIGGKYGTEKNPVSIDIAYNIFKNEKELKSQISTPKPKLPNPLRSTEIAEPVSDEEIKKKGMWELVEDAKKILRGGK